MFTYKTTKLNCHGSTLSIRVVGSPNDRLMPYDGKYICLALALGSTLLYTVTPADADFRSDFDAGHPSKLGLYLLDSILTRVLAETSERTKTYKRCYNQRHILIGRNHWNTHPIYSNLPTHLAIRRRR